MNKVSYLSKCLGIDKNTDSRLRKEVIKGELFCLFYLSSLVSNEAFIKLVESLYLVDYKENIDNLLVSSFYVENRLKSVVNAVLEGNLALVLPNDVVLVCDVKKYPSRGISSSQVEKSVRGSKDSFNENLIDNIALIRRRIKSTHLAIRLLQVSKESKMSVGVIYMDNVADMRIVRSIKRRIVNLDLESLIMADRGLEESMFNQGYHIVPLVRYTERPDVASINLIRGKVVLLVDTSSNAIIVPISIFDHYKNIEEYKQNPLIGSFTKTLRIIGSLTSVFLVPVFALFTFEGSFDNGVIPLYSLQIGNPILVEILVVSVILEIIRIAIVHTPSALISALSLLAAIVLGEISISLGLFSPEILLVTSLSIVCNFATPSYELSLANRFLSFLFVVVTCLFKVEGFLMGVIVLFVYLCSIRVLGLPYLYPICPFDYQMFKKMFVRHKVEKRK